MVNIESKRQYENELLVLKEIKKLHNSKGKLNIYFISPKRISTTPHSWLSRRQTVKLLSNH